MELSLELLKNSILFNGLNEEEIKKLIDGVNIFKKEYSVGEIIALEGDPCNSLSLILCGEVEIHKPFTSGKIVTISHFSAGNIFAESLVFSNKKEYPANVISTTKSTILFIPRKELSQLLSKNPIVIENFAGVLSKRIHMLNDRITNLSLDTTRKKIVNILLLEYARQKTSSLLLPYSRKKMAELLNIPRPSLSRELIKMKQDGLIDFYKNRFKILDLKKLEKTLN
ncbi:MAG: Crp/Fnr family transcriptional regulator [Gudongella sp.]|nr:Crp/Fnr family transcriptional regulator [Gudongella sp.]